MVLTIVRYIEYHRQKTQANRRYGIHHDVSIASNHSHDDLLGLHSFLPLARRVPNLRRPPRRHCLFHRSVRFLYRLRQYQLSMPRMVEYRCDEDHTDASQGGRFSCGDLSYIRFRLSSVRINSADAHCQLPDRICLVRSRMINNEIGA